MLTDNLQITTMTIDAKINNISFNEKLLTEGIIDRLKHIVASEDRILKITSNYIDPDIISDKLISAELQQSKTHFSEPLICKRGRKKKDVTRFRSQQRKKQGTGKHFNSQITFMIRSFTILNKIYNIKLFRTGSIGVPGINFLDDITLVLRYLVDRLNFVFELDNLCLSEIVPKMINYKTFFVIKDGYILNYTRLKNILNLNHSDMLSTQVTIQKDKNNCLSIRPSFISPTTGRKERYLIEMFLSGKTNTKGLYPREVMVAHLKLIESYLNDDSCGILRKRYDSPEEIYELLTSCSSTCVEHDL